MDYKPLLIKITKYFLKGVIFLPLLFFAFLFFSSVVDAYRGFFLPKESRFDVALDDFDEMEITMDWLACVNPNFGSGHLEYKVSRPFNTDYSIRSTSSPLTMTVGFQKGVVNIEGITSGITKTIQATRDISELQGITFRANQMEVQFDQPDNLALVGNICTPKLIVYGGFLSGEISQAAFLKNDQDYSRVHTIQSFKNPNEKVYIHFLGVELDDELYDELFVSYESNQIYRESELQIWSNGKGLRFDIPNGENVIADQESTSKIESAYVDDVKIINPIGQITLEYEGVIKFLPKVGTSIRNELALKHDDSYLIITEGSSSGIVSIFGNLTKALYLGNRLNHSKWEQLSPDVQAAFIAALLGALGFLLVKTSPEIYKYYSNTIDKYFPQSPEIKEEREKTMPPSGTLILELNSGKVLAGYVISTPSWFKRKYILSDVFVKISDDEWQKISGTVSVETNQISYTYVYK